MLKNILILPTLLLGLVAWQFLNFNVTEADLIPPQPQKNRYVVENSPTNANPLRIGVVLGGQTNWGTEQFRKNIVFNPGFEGDFTRFVVVVSQADFNSFSNEGWEQPDGYWKGASFDIRTGPNAGKQGKISDSLKAGVNGQPQYFSEEPIPKLVKDDVVVLMKENIAEPPGNWWVLSTGHKGVGVSPDHRPDSPGTQSGVLTSDGKNVFSLLSYIDHFGKYLKIEGRWNLSFWAKGEGRDATLKISFKRLNGSPQFLEREIKLTTEWKEYHFDFNAHDSGKTAMLSLEFALLPRENTKVYLDDVSLTSSEDASPIAFRKEVVSLLKQLHPSYLRDWQGQNSDTFANRIATPFARKSFGMTPSDGIMRDLNWAYSIPELLEVCEAVGANPWIVIPVVLTDEEYKDLGKYLAIHASKSRFSDVILEFGNENWNWMFRPAGYPYPEVHGKVFERAYHLISAETKDAVHLTKTVNGQEANPWLTLKYATFAPSADLMAVAGYYVSKINTGIPKKNALAAFFSPSDGDLNQILEGLKGMHKPLAIYEINAGTVDGTATASERNAIIAGGVSGTILAKHLLYALFSGIQPSMVFTFSQLDTPILNSKEKVDLWGITVDLSPTLRFRPTGLAIKMLNKVIGGSLYKTKREGFIPLDPFTIAAFKQAHGWTFAALSEKDSPQTVEIVFPEDGNPHPTSLMSLDFKDPYDTNEDAENVKIIERKLISNGRSIQISIPAYGMIVAF